MALLRTVREDFWRGWSAPARDIMIGALFGLAVSASIGVLLAVLLSWNLAVSTVVIVGVQLIACYVVAGGRVRRRSSGGN